MVGGGTSWSSAVNTTAVAAVGRRARPHAPVEQTTFHNFWARFILFRLATHVRAPAAPHAHSERVELAMRCTLTESGAVDPTRRASRCSCRRVAPPPRVWPASPTRRAPHSGFPAM